MSKELIERLREGHKFGDSDAVLEATDLIEAQQSWIASLEQNARDADRMYKELETELAEQQKRIDYLESRVDSWTRDAQTLMSKLAASQAQIKVLRDALNAAKYATKPSITLELIEAALAQPTDTTALQAAIAEEREAILELRNHEDVLAPVGQSAWGEAYQDGWIAGVQEYVDQIRARGIK